MTKKIIFQQSFYVSGIMCFVGCGRMLWDTLNDLSNFKEQNFLPQDAEIIINPEPLQLGTHQLVIVIESEQEEFNLEKVAYEKLAFEFKTRIKALGFTISDNNKNLSSQAKLNWLNIVINLGIICLIVILSVVAPPSLPLTVSLVGLTFLTTAFTARSYFRDFFSNLANKKFSPMSTPIGIGWLLSLAHTLYHSIKMPLMTNFWMIFMNFHMPIVLVTVLNGMEVIKEFVLRKMHSIHKQGVKTLFPQMAEDYHCYQLPAAKESLLLEALAGNHAHNQPFSSPDLQDLLASTFRPQARQSLKKGMLMWINPNECFPVDGIIIDGDTLVDASLITGETRQAMQALDRVPAGAINLSKKVLVYTTQDCYNSTFNRLLFASNRARKEQQLLPPQRTFIYLYLGLILISLIASVLIPYCLGVLTIPLLLQNIIGILFSICPCTIAIAHELPKTLGYYQLGNREILLRHENLLEQFDEIETFVFDKTGTLTTANSEVDSSEGLSAKLWQRIYLLEKYHGANHPIARAISTHYQKKYNFTDILFKDIDSVALDENHRGLSARVQKKEIHLGNLEYFLQNQLPLPEITSPFSEAKLTQGFTPVYVAEDRKYCGVIFIKHGVRKNILPALTQLKESGKTMIMLTGDSRGAAKNFNEQINGIFAEENIIAQQTPEGKEAYLGELLNKQSTHPRKVCFVGDGLNDAPSARLVSDSGGISCSITSTDKSAFFTDLHLNGSLDYFFASKKIKNLLHKIIRQNEFILGGSNGIFLAAIILFSIVGMPVSPLVPVLVMSLTALICMLNSYRSKYAVDQALKENQPAMATRLPLMNPSQEVVNQLGIENQYLPSSLASLPLNSVKSHPLPLGGKNRKLFKADFKYNPMDPLNAQGAKRTYVF